MTYLPLFIDVRGWKILVFGGGNVGLRRAKMFLEAGAEVIVVAKDFHYELENMAKNNRNLKLIRAEWPRDRELVEELVKQARLVVIASSNTAANTAIAEFALSLGKLVNNATEAHQGNTVVPFQATVYEGIHIAVTSLGLAGVAARHVLEEIVGYLEKNSRLKTLFKVMSRIKDYMKKTINDPKERYKLYFIIDKDPLFQEFIAKGDEAKAFKRGLEIIYENIFDS